MQGDAVANINRYLNQMLDATPELANTGLADVIRLAVETHNPNIINNMPNMVTASGTASISSNAKANMLKVYNDIVAIRKDANDNFLKNVKAFPLMTASGFRDNVVMPMIDAINARLPGTITQHSGIYSAHEPLHWNMGVVNGK